MKQAVEQYIPHAAPMVFIDELLECGDDYVLAKLTVRSALMFADQQGLPSWVSIELMAQTISLYAGLQGKKLEQPPKIGFLLGTRKMNFPMAYFPLGSELIIKASKSYVHENLGVFVCELQYLEFVITATLSVFEPDDIGLKSWK